MANKLQVKPKNTDRYLKGLSLNEMDDVEQAVEYALEDPGGTFTMVSREHSAKLSAMNKTVKSISGDTKYIRKAIDKFEKKLDDFIADGSGGGTSFGLPDVPWRNKPGGPTGRKPNIKSGLKGAGGAAMRLLGLVGGLYMLDEASPYINKGIDNMLPEGAKPAPKIETGWGKALIGSDIGGNLGYMTRQWVIKKYQDTFGDKKPSKAKNSIAKRISFQQNNNIINQQAAPQRGIPELTPSQRAIIIRERLKGMTQIYGKGVGGFAPAGGISISSGRGAGGGRGGSGGGGWGGDEGAPAVQKLSPAAQAQMDAILSGKTLTSSSFLSGKTEQELQSMGISRSRISSPENPSMTATTYKKTSPNISEDEINKAMYSSSGNVASGTGNLKDKDKWMKGTYDSYRNNGFSHNQALAFTAEVGRENGYNPDTMFGTHEDLNGKTNFGMLSMQGDRKPALEKFLREKGRYGPDGRLIQDQKTLDAQAAFHRKEIEENPSYAKTKKLVLDNPNVSKEEAAAVLGDNYIRWARHGNAKIGFSTSDAARHNNIRSNYYDQASNLTSQDQFKGITPAQFAALSPEEQIKVRAETKQRLETAKTQDQTAALRIGLSSTPSAAVNTQVAGNPDQVLADVASGKINPAAAAVDEALKMKGLHEVKDREQIKDYLKSGQSVDPNDAWCADFVNASLAKAGIKGTGAPSAGSFTSYGQAVTDPASIRKGDIVVNKKKSERSGLIGSHVGMAIGPAYKNAKGEWVVDTVNGNSGDKVTTRTDWVDLSNVRRSTPDHYTKELKQALAKSKTSEEKKQIAALINNKPKIPASAAVTPAPTQLGLADMSGGTNNYAKYRAEKDKVDLSVSRAKSYAMYDDINNPSRAFPTIKKKAPLPLTPGAEGKSDKIMPQTTEEIRKEHEEIKKRNRKALQSDPNSPSNNWRQVLDGTVKAPTFFPKVPDGARENLVPQIQRPVAAAVTPEKDWNQTIIDGANATAQAAMDAAQNATKSVYDWMAGQKAAAPAAANRIPLASKNPPPLTNPPRTYHRATQTTNPTAKTPGSDSSKSFGTTTESEAAWQYPAIEMGVP